MTSKTLVGLLAALGVLGTAVDLLPLAVHAGYGRKSGLGHLDCRAATFGKPAGLRWVSRYAFDRDRLSWLKAAYLGGPDRFYPSVYKTLTYVRVDQAAIDAVAGSGAAFSLPGLDGFARAAADGRAWGSAEPDLRVLPFLLKHPEKAAKYGAIPFDLDLFAVTGDGRRYALTEFASASLDKVSKLDHRQGIELLKALPEALALCDAADLRLASAPGSMP
jgi:hypothetical protein